MLHNQDRPMIAFVLQSARKKDFASAKVKEGAAGGQMLRLSKEFECKQTLSVCITPGVRGYLYQDPTPGVMQTERVCLHSQTLSIIVAFGLLPRLL